MIICDKCKSRMFEVSEDGAIIMEYKCMECGNVTRKENDWSEYDYPDYYDDEGGVWL